MSDRFLAEGADVTTRGKQAKAWDKNRPRCMRNNYEIMENFRESLDDLGLYYDDDDDDDCIALKLYLSDACCDLMFSPKSSVDDPCTVYKQMNTALREYRAGGKLIGSLCYGAKREVEYLYECNDYEPPAYTVYFGIEIELDISGGRMFLKNFRSTTTDVSVAQSFGDYVYELQLTGDIVCASVADYATFDESEVLINPGQWVDICEYDDDDYDHDDYDDDDEDDDSDDCDGGPYCVKCGATVIVSRNFRGTNYKCVGCRY